MPNPPAPPQATVVVEADGRVVAVTDAACVLLGSTPDAPEAPLSPDDRDVARRAAGTVRRGDAAEAGFSLRGVGGRPLWVEVRGEAGGRIAGTVRPGRRPRFGDRAEADRLRLLATVTSHGAEPFRVRLDRALGLTSDLLDLETAIVSRIADGTYTVYACHAGGGPLAPGDTFPLGDTVCSLTLAGPDILALDEIGSGPHRAHPAYDRFGIESYVGIPVVVRGETWGTLSFSSTRPLGGPPCEADRDLVRLLALWVGGEIEREESRRALAESERRYRALGEATFEALAFSDAGVVLDCNDQFARLFGYESVEAVVGRRAADLCTPQALPLVQRMILENRPEPYEAQLRRADGSTFWGEIRGSQSVLGGRPVRVTAIHDVSARHALSAELAYQATHDALTGLPNRTLFYDRLAAALDAAAPFAVLFIDLDRFKVVNDSLGHDRGDFLLAVVAGRLRDALGAVEGATVARLGGDEFAVLAPTGGGGRGADVGRAVLEALRPPVDLGPRAVSPNASVGVVEGAQRYDAPEALVRDADTAMYEAKGAGRDGLAVFDPSMHRAATERFQLEHDLRRALAEGELRVYLQPIARLGTGRVVGFEALVRWAHPERGVLAPGAFLPLAEEVGLVSEIDDWVLEAACLELGRAGLDEGALLWLSVNCSDDTFLGGRLQERVRRALDRSGIAPERLVLELTERAMVDADTARETIRTLHDLGARVSIDDFGTAYSSLGLLHALPVDGIKIDRSFVADLEGSDSARAIVRAVIQMASDLGLHVVAEGVETPGQLEVLREAGCTYAQGYAFAPPLPAERAAALLGTRLGGPGG